MIKQSRVIEVLRHCVPKVARDFIAELLGYAGLSRRMQQLETRQVELLQRIEGLKLLPFELKEQLWERSRVRWKSAPPNGGLTWGRIVTGEGFISKISSYNAFMERSVILEVGPGYGRLLKSLLQQGIPFKKYVGVDISAKNITYLKETFKADNIYFVQGDIESIILEERFDVVLSSLTFKHLFPSFEKALNNVVNYINPGGMFFFDLIEGKRTYFEENGVTYIRHYTRSEIQQILRNVSLELVTFDEVKHDKEHSRLLVVARKP